MSTELVRAVNTSDASSDRCRTILTLKVSRRLALSPSATVMRTGSMSGLRSSQPAMQVLTSALMTPTVRSGEPILKLTVCRG